MYQWIIVDGNNLVHSDQDGLFGDHRTDFDSARRALARLLDELVGELAEKVTIVFDGTIGGTDETFQASDLQVIFAPSDKTADDVIERMAAKAPEPGRVLVVSSDRGERDTVRAAGAETMSCRHFIELVRECRQTLHKRLVQRSRLRGSRPSLGDFFPQAG